MKFSQTIQAFFSIALCFAALWSPYYREARADDAKISQIKYSITDLGVIPNIAAEVSLGLNDRGQVAGWHSATDQAIHAFFWRAGVLTDVVPPVGYPNSIARAVNSKGDAVGWINTSRNPVDSLSTMHAALYSQGQVHDLGTLGGRDSQAFAINDQGLIVGISYVTPTTRHAFLTHQEKMQDLGTLPAGSFSAGYDINRRGDIVGVSATSARTVHAVLWHKTVAQDLGTLPDGKNSYGRAVNNKGQVVGFADSEDDTHAFLYDGGKMMDLGTLGGDTSIAEGINDAGQVVGASNVDFLRRHAFLWQAGRMTDINVLIPARPKWTLLDAYRINNRGQIVCIGRSPDGDRHGLLLTPTGH